MITTMFASAIWKANKPEAFREGQDEIRSLISSWKKKEERKEEERGRKKKEERLTQRKKAVEGGLVWAQMGHTTK